ncbi:hypothetical protein D3C75_780550 [compost metagenome]
MAQGIVNRLETVQIDKKHRTRMPAKKFNFEITFEPMPVRQLGQRIMIGHTLQHMPVQKYRTAGYREHEQRDKRNPRQQNHICLHQKRLSTAPVVILQIGGPQAYIVHSRHCESNEQRGVELPAAKTGMIFKFMKKKYSSV